VAATPSGEPTSELITVGHGTLGAEALTDLLRGAGVGRIVDVRKMPASRRHPHLCSEELSAWLPAAGVEYRWEPRLGGFRPAIPDSPNIALRHRSFRAYADWMETAEFGVALDELLARDDRLTAVMCAESLWWRCHRRLIADAAVLLREVDVRHLGHDGRLQPHHPTDGVRVLDGVLRYDQVQPAS
jgi:uncharacterized protein (DUF488 family)